MAKIVRSTQKIFGVNAAQNQITEFGSIKAGAPVYSQNVANIQTAAFEGGWSDALQYDYAPYRQDRNAVDLVTTSQLAYLFQEGIPEWDAGTVYYKGSLAKVITTSATVQVYMSKVDDNTANYSNADNWAKIFDTGSPYALDSDVVKLAGDQTVGGRKTFTLTPIISGATPNTVAVFDADKKLVSNTNISNTELGYLDGVTSNIQTQLNAKQASGSYATTNTAQTISAVKTFSAVPKISATIAAADNSTQASTTAWVNSRINNIIDNEFPNYNSVSNLTWNANNTIAKDGLVWVSFYGNSDTDQTIKINNWTYTHQTRNAAVVVWTFPVKKGDIVYCSGGYSQQKLYFFPMRNA